MTFDVKELLKVIHQAQTDIHAATDRLAHHKLLVDNKIESYTQCIGLLHKRIKKLENALLILAERAGDDPLFNKGGEAYEAVFGDEEVSRADNDRKEAVVFFKNMKHIPLSTPKRFCKVNVCWQIVEVDGEPFMDAVDGICPKHYYTTGIPEVKE